MSTEKWVKDRADVYLRQGGKTNRRETVRVLIRILDDIQKHDGCAPAQIGRKQVIGYYKRQQLSAATLRRHAAAIALLWKWLDRVSEPPRPKAPSGGALEIGEPQKPKRSVDNSPAHTPR